MNRLATEHSPYLQSAAAQPVKWLPWGPEAFEKARREDKPILLDIGAVWCHWCHVMDQESYEEDAIAGIINSHFVPIKVDRDERPDVDARYQLAVSAISGQGGWPLTAFLLPDGRVFFGGTYFPPEDRHGRPGFPKVLLGLSEAYQKEREKVLQNADRLSAFLSQQSPAPSTDSLDDRVIEQALNDISRSIDVRHGGFGSAPKFPHPGAIEFLLACADRRNETWMIDAVTAMLRAMACGGIYDQIGGGFHRYSTDERWIVPHFEKMLYDNAALLMNYLHAFQATQDPFFREIAQGIITFMQGTLSDTQGGGFFASQDADVNFGDDGSYFTWSLEDLRKTVSEAELDVVQARYDVHEQGEMSHDRTQNVLFIATPIDEIASRLGKPVEEIERLLDSGRRKMTLAREKKKAPLVDRSLFANWNGMAISAFLEASRVLDDERLLGQALRSLDRILREHSGPDGLLTHRAAAIKDDAFLDDQVQVAYALLDAYEVTGETTWLGRAKELMLRAIDLFWDSGSGGFNDLPRNRPSSGSLKTPFKSAQDSPTPAANSVAILVLNRLHAFTEEPVFNEYAEKTLRYFLGSVTGYGIFAATYFLALERFLHRPPHVIVFAPEDSPEGKRLHRRALSTYRPGTMVERRNPRLNPRLPNPFPIPDEREIAGPVAYVCASTSCAPPVSDPSQLEQTIRDFGRIAAA